MHLGLRRFTSGVELQLNAFTSGVHKIVLTTAPPLTTEHMVLENSAHLGDGKNIVTSGLIHHRQSSRRTSLVQRLDP